MTKFTLTIVVDKEDERCPETYFGRAENYWIAVSKIYEYIINKSRINDEKTKFRMADSIRYMLERKSGYAMECSRYKERFFKTTFVVVLAKVEEA